MSGSKTEEGLPPVAKNKEEHRVDCELGNCTMWQLEIKSNAKMKRPYSLFEIFTVLAIMLSGCALQHGPLTTPSTELLQARETISVETPSPTSAPDKTPSAASAPTKQSSEITATVWPRDPIVPVLAYHQFQEHGISGSTRVRLDDFQGELESLLQAGYSLVPLSRWLAGDLRLAAGKRPLVFTMDDVFYRNQIRFNADGTIDSLTGLGAAYQFAHMHPDFGFSWALFSNLGDKPYIDENNPLVLANAIIWCIEHGAMVYNHTYTHALLSQTSPRGITWELSANDKMLEQLLNRAGRPDLIPTLGNIFALPYGKWPRDPAGETAIENYRNPSGVPMQAIMDIDYIYRPKYMLPPYAPEFRRWDVPRIVATISAVDYFSKNAAELPTAQSCLLGPLDLGRTSDSDYLAEQIDRAIQHGGCPQGVYATDKYVFRAEASGAHLILTVSAAP